MFKSVVLVAIAVASCTAGPITLPNGILPIDPAANQQSTNYIKPKFCHDLECPNYSVLETNDKFEVRHYEPSVWVATNLTTMLYTKAQNSAMFMKLFNYIAGNNSANTKIPMTAPVVTEVFHGQGPDCESNFTMHFMMPFNLQANPPTPTDDSVFIRRVDAANVIVKSYGGFNSDELKRQNLEEFIQDLNAANKLYADNVFYTAGYDGPYQFANRHNELWVVAL